MIKQRLSYDWTTFFPLSFYTYIGAVAIFGLLMGLGLAGDVRLVASFWNGTSSGTTTKIEKYPQAHYAVQSSSELIMTPELQLVAEQIQKELAYKYLTHPQVFQIDFRTHDDKLAYGTVLNLETNATGWWLATQVDGEWRLVANRSDTIYCSQVEELGFPPAMVPECLEDNEVLLATSI
jgi:hypothetical protein